MADTTDSPVSGAPSQADIIDLYQALRAQWGERNGRYQKARLAYDGDHWEGQGLDRPGQRRYALTANYIGPIVDKDVQLLMGQLPAIMSPPPSADQPGRDLAEKLEGLLYGNWDLNKAHMQLLNVAWHSVTLGMGIIGYWWDADSGHVRWKSMVPENFYPNYDGDEIEEAIYVSRRLTRALRRQYPQYANEISEDDGGLAYANQLYPAAAVSGGVMEALLTPEGWSARPESATGYTTVIDYYDRTGLWVRMMGAALHSQRLGYPGDEIPFIEIQNSVNGDEREPKNVIDRILELNQYYNVLLSQKADIIRKTADPPVVDEGSGQAPAVLKTHLAGDGSVIPTRAGSKLYYLTWEQGAMPDIEGQLNEVRDVLFDISGKPRSSFGQTVTNQSGVVTNLTLTPTLQSNELRQTVWGAAIERLNRNILALYEEFSPTTPIHFKTTGRKMRGSAVRQQPYDVTLTGKEIMGWHKNKLKWPSAIRVDDPVYLDGVLKQVQAEPQLISAYDALELLGYQDVEAMIERIRAEREDPRLHPEILQQTLESLAQLGGMTAPGMDGFADVDSATGDVPVGMSGGQVGNMTGQVPSPVPA